VTLDSEPYVTPIDIELLRHVARTGSLAAGARAMGMSRDRGVYRLDRLRRIGRGPVVRTTRGGRSFGGTRLTALGWRLLKLGSGPVRFDRSSRVPTGSSQFSGTWHAAPHPHVRVGAGFEIAVAFAAEEGETVSVVLDPEAVLLASRRFASSARNVFVGTIRSIRATGPGLALVTVGWGRHAVRALVTDGAIRELHLARGRPAVAYVKATAVRRVARPTP